MAGRARRRPGDLCWAARITTDRTGAARLVRDLFGWDFLDVPLDDERWLRIALCEGEPVGSIHMLADQPPAAVLGPRWDAYVLVADLDRAIEAARRTGGSLLLPPAPVSGDEGVVLGTSAIVRDPTGVAVGLWEAGTVGEVAPTAAAGTLEWATWFSEDPEGSARFAEAVLGWSFAQVMEDPPYWIAHTGRRRCAGMLPAATIGRSGLVPSFAVADVPAAVQLVGAAGGTPLLGPEEIASGTVAVLAEWDGALVAILRAAPPA
jgi:predicted enzyme related to lactoylglutathione lyase